VQEAVQLVIQAAALGRDGEALVLEMGRPIRIAEVAKQMAEQADSPIEIVYTGLRPGEKLHEELFGNGEKDERPLHNLISHVAVPALDPAEVRMLDPYAEPEQVVKELTEVCELDGPFTDDESLFLGWERIGRQARSSRHARESIVSEPGRQGMPSVTLLRTAVQRQDTPSTVQPPR